MSSRDNILMAVKASQPAITPLPDMHTFERNAAGSLEKFATVLKSVGGVVYYVSNYEEIVNILLQINGENKKIISAVSGLTAHYNELFFEAPQITDMHDIDLAVIKGLFGVAENGAIWATDKEIRVRALPFICQHLAIILDAEAIVPTMHEAYEVISATTYDFGTFIAGPSKTADIEQSLVIGAHGPRSVTVFIFKFDNHA